jgi:hypothetical protein
MVALAQQLRHFHEAVRARSHVQERSTLVQMMQEDAALLADLKTSTWPAMNPRRYTVARARWDASHTIQSTDPTWESTHCSTIPCLSHLCRKLCYPPHESATPS